MKSLAVLAVIAMATPAWAQSTRYPKPPVDHDRVLELHSDLWDAAIHPAKGPYKVALDDANEKLNQHTDDDRVAAIEILDRAITDAPDEPAAYLARGRAHLELRHWVQCADDYAAGLDRVRHVATLDAEDGVIKPETRLDLGVCQARAGRLADAERTLADAAAAGSRSPQVWMRLGETRMAMGKLDEARAALDTAIELTDGVAQTSSLWLRALANDRARQPSAAEDDIRRALGFDGKRTMIEAPPLPLLGDDETDYAMALSSADADPREPELAIARFRLFVDHAPRSPWRRRAEEHLHELRAIDLPLAVTVKDEGVKPDPDAAARAVRAVMPKLRACLAKLPGVVLKVTLTRDGPRLADSPDRPRYTAPPPDGAAVEPVLKFDALGGDIDTAVRCVQPLAEVMAMPAVTVRGGYYRVSFDVIQ